MRTELNTDYLGSRFSYLVIFTLQFKMDATFEILTSEETSDLRKIKNFS